MSYLNLIQCPQCRSTSYRKNGKYGGKQRYQCKHCQKSFFGIVFTPPPPPPEPGISVLLLDVENLKINSQTENYLSQICQYPLQVKIAFANWKCTSLHKQDTILYERGYQLIHVPEGKNGADGKMITIGASIFLQYPDTKEIFICSNDTIFNHLCIDLENRGLVVYRLFFKEKIICIENRKTGQINYYCPQLESEIPDLKGICEQIQDLINLENQSLQDRLIQLDKITELFATRSKIEQNDSLNLINFETVSVGSNPKSKSQSKINFTSRDLLEKELINIVKILGEDLPDNKVPITTLAAQFQSQNKQSIKKALKQLSLECKLSKFLQQVNNLELIKEGNIYYVCYKQTKG